MNWGERYIDHYEQWFRAPVTRRIYSQESDDHSIQILAYDRVFEGCRLFASLGLTHYADEVGQVAEVYLPVDADWERAPAVFANALFYIVQEAMSIGRGVGIGGVGTLSPDFEREFQKEALYITNPFDLPDGASVIECDGKQGRLYEAFFISKKEYDYFLMYGAEKFEDMIQERALDPYKLARPSCVL